MHGRNVTATPGRFQDQPRATLAAGGLHYRAAPVPVQDELLLLFVARIKVVGSR
jgi:hypothetical protein